MTLWAYAWKESTTTFLSKYSAVLADFEWQWQLISNLYCKIKWIDFWNLIRTVAVFREYLWCACHCDMKWYLSVYYHNNPETQMFSSILLTQRVPSWELEKGVPSRKMHLMPGHTAGRAKHRLDLRTPWPQRPYIFVWGTTCTNVHGSPGFCVFFFFISMKRNERPCKS